jgi:predicted small secreted protein
MISSTIQNAKASLRNYEKAAPTGVYKHSTRCCNRVINWASLSYDEILYCISRRTVMSLHKKYRVFLLLILIVALQGLAACNTVRGAGEDISAAGDAIEDKAEQKKRY